MEKKTKIQIFLFTVLLLLIYLTFSFYYVTDNFEDQSTTNEPNTNEIENNIPINNKDLIENIKYISNNTKGDIYEILADFGEVSIENPDLMFLTNVRGNVIFKNKSNINLVSDFANFNTKTFETTFINNVKVSREDEIITGEELYLVLDEDENISEKDLNKEKNLLRMSRNVQFKKPGYSLKADIFEIDLITKNSKIYMNDKIKKITGATSIK
jgi:hypothetical protein